MKFLEQIGNFENSGFIKILDCGIRDFKFGISKFGILKSGFTKIRDCEFRFFLNLTELN